MSEPAARIGWSAIDARAIPNHPAPAAGWNAAAALTDGAWRIPLENLPVDCGDDSAHAATRELARPAATAVGRGRAVVIAPAVPSPAVDVLLFFHGKNIGWRRRASGDAPRDVALDRLESQLTRLHAEGMPLIAVLPQGTIERGGALSRFGALDADAYIAASLAASGAHPATSWLARASVRRVVAGGHSGGGIDLSHMLLGRGGMRAPARLRGVLHFDAINYRGAEPADHWSWSASLLEAQRSALGALAPDARRRYLDDACGLAAFHSGSRGPDGYGTLYDAHRSAFDGWFAALGDAFPRDLRDRWRDRFRFEQIASSHEALVGAGEPVVRGLKALLRGRLPSP
jgi:hypothetical protein